MDLSKQLKFDVFDVDVKYTSDYVKSLLDHRLLSVLFK